MDLKKVHYNSRVLLHEAPTKKGNFIQYLDALEHLKSQGFQEQSITTRRYEILYGFVDYVWRREIAVIYCLPLWNHCLLPHTNFGDIVLNRTNGNHPMLHVCHICLRPLILDSRIGTSDTPKGLFHLRTISAFW